MGDFTDLHTVYIFYNCRRGARVGLDDRRSRGVPRSGVVPEVRDGGFDVVEGGAAWARPSSSSSSMASRRSSSSASRSRRRSRRADSESSRPYSSIFSRTDDICSEIRGLPGGTCSWRAVISVRAVSVCELSRRPVASSPIIAIRTWRPATESLRPACPRRFGGETCSEEALTPRRG